MAFSFIKSYEANWTSNANHAAWDAIISNIESYINTNFTISASVAVTFGYGTVNGASLAGRSGGNQANYVGTKTYATVKSTLQGLPTDAVKTVAYANLPASDPSSFPNYTYTTALNAILTSGTDNNPLAKNYMGWASSGVTWDLTADGSTCAAGQVSLWGIMFHEITELLGRSSRLDVSQTTPLDLFVYTASGTRSFSTTAASRYFSYDGGVTNHGGTDDVGTTAFYDGTHGTTGDDWFGWGGSFHSPFNEQNLFTGQVLRPTAGDLKQLAVIGWPLSAAGETAAGLGGGGGGGSTSRKGFSFSRNL
jgi:hypothetical protein